MLTGQSLTKGRDERGQALLEPKERTVALFLTQSLELQEDLVSTILSILEHTVISGMLRVLDHLLNMRKVPHQGVLIEELDFKRDSEVWQFDIEEQIARSRQDVGLEVEPDGLVIDTCEGQLEVLQSDAA